MQIPRVKIQRKAGFQVLGHDFSVWPATQNMTHWSH